MSPQKKIILVPSLNIVNFPMFYALSFFFRIKAYEIERFTPRSGRIGLVELADYFNWDNYITARSEAVDATEGLISKLDRGKWQARINSKAVDLSSKIKKDLRKQAETLYFLSEIKRAEETENNTLAMIAHSLKSKALRDLDRDHMIFSESDWGLLSYMNITCDRVNIFLADIGMFFNALKGLIKGFIFNEHKLMKTVKYIYDDDLPKALNTSELKMSFDWLVDDKIITKKEMLFILPGCGGDKKKKIKDYIRKKRLIAEFADSSLKAASPKSIARAFGDLIAAFFKLAISCFTYRGLFKASYVFIILRYAPLADSIQPKAYIWTFANIAIENPAISYFNASGIKSISWMYSTSTGRFSKDAEKRAIKLRCVKYCDIMADVVITWNRQFKEFLEEHPHTRRPEIKTIGPLMNGDEGVMINDRPYLFSKIGIPFDPGLKYITVFDKAQINRRLPSVATPVNTPGEYNHNFLKDVFRLLEEKSDVFLLFKPKRNINMNAHYPDEVIEFYKIAKETKRVFIFDPDIDPWIPLALSDLCLNLPFGSANFAAMHYGKPMIFHDPWGAALYHRYGKIDKLITHNYTEFKNKVEEVLYSKNVNEVYRDVDIADFIGASQKSNSSKEFRRYLKEI